ncbi:MAG: Maf-like protein [Planctomycetes bacterium]|nr:Maf-like protein [Planctomycetota bacterium]
MAAELDLLLASKSPRRRQLLTAAGVRFALCEPGEEYQGAVTEHDREGGDPRELAVQRARRKALGARAPGPAPGASGGDGSCGSVPVLAVDTVVDLDGEEFGKARDRAAAEAMLRLLSGREHLVHTAHCLVDAAGAVRDELVTATVRCAPVGEVELAAYLDSGQWRDKAGAYGLQDDAQRFLTLADGAFDTVVGLHVPAVLRLLALATGRRREGA